MANKYISSLRLARVTRGLTLQDISKLLGVSGVTIHNWETGKSEPDVSNAMKLAKIYETEINVLFNTRNSK